MLNPHKNYINRFKLKKVEIATTQKGLKMFTRRNWLLRCSIIINVAVILYLGSHVMIGGGSNFSTGSAYIIQDEAPKAQHLEAAAPFKGEQANVREPLSQQDQSPQSTSEDKPQQLQQRQQQQQQSQPLQQEEDEAPAAVGNDGPTPEHPQVLELKEIPDKKISEAPTDSTLDAGVMQESSSYVNNSSPDGYMVTGDEKDFDERLRSLLKCHDRDYKPVTLQRGDFWVLQNYVRADHGDLKCHETITYTTHADYTFLDNLIPLLERWNAPVSIALHAPGTDFAPTLNSIKYLRDCLPESNLVRQFVTFHIYFSTKHIPKAVAKSDQVLSSAYNCTIPPPFFNLSGGHLYKTQKKLLYPVNVGRNIARDAALTHFILASDIELYPNPGLVKKFLEMIARNEAYLHRKAPRVFPLSIFEVESSAAVPRDKTELQELLRLGKAIPFHKRVCSSCHGVPKSKEWMAANETEELGIFHIGKRVGYFVHWEPIYIGTNADPHYDERLSWEGKSDKMTQGYALCVLDYEFHILDNAFLVHKPGIKVLKKDPRRAMLAALAVECPKEEGRFASPGQCDAYIECFDGVGEEKFCPDGLLFNDKVTSLACEYPNMVDCGSRTKFQDPQPTDDCPHQFGYYRMGGKGDCGKFMNCAEGRGYALDCPEDLAYNSKVYHCDWPDLVPECDAEEYLGFQCPKEDDKLIYPGDEEYTFYPAPGCEKYYICTDGKPRRIGCGEGYGFNPETKACDSLENFTCPN